MFVYSKDYLIYRPNMLQPDVGCVPPHLQDRKTNLLPTRGEDRRVLKAGSIPVAQTCKWMKVVSAENLINA